MPPIFMTLLTVSLDFSPGWEMPESVLVINAKTSITSRLLTARLSATVRCDAVADYFDPVSRQLRVARFHRHGSRGMLIPSRIFVIALQPIANFDNRQ